MNMKNLTAQDIAFFLRIDQKAAKGKLTYCILKMNGLDPDLMDHDAIKNVVEDHGNVVPVDVASKLLQYDFNFAIQDVKKRALKPGPTRHFIVNHIPSIAARAFRSPLQTYERILDHQQRQEVLDAWYENRFLAEKYKRLKRNKRF